MTRLAMSPTTPDRVYDEILRRITDRTLTAGERLPESSLAKELEVSRTPVRQALHRLEREGIVVLVPGGGARLASPTLREIEDTMEVRIYLERLVVRKLAPQMTPLQYFRLEEVLQEQQNAHRHYSDLLHGDSFFHHLLAESTGNHALTDSLDALLARSTTFRVLFAGRENYDNHLIVEEHTAILEALRDHDTDLAEKRLVDHLDAALTELAQSVEITASAGLPITGNKPSKE